MNREGGGTTSRGTLHVRSSDPSEGRPLHLALNVPYLLGEVPRACNSTSEPMAHIDGHADVIAVRSRDEDRDASRSREEIGTALSRRGPIRNREPVHARASAVRGAMMTGHDANGGHEVQGRRPTREGERGDPRRPASAAGMRA